jgi:peptide/nickel transport system substrate-binding protein/oligopeptide transport system substrate-binding protein
LWDDPLALDPALGTDVYAISVIQQLFDGLVQFDADLNVIPSLARAWSASRDGKSWTFYLRPGVTFHNGREVTANDVVYSFTRLLDPHLKSPLAWVFEHVQGTREFLAGTAARVSGLRTLDNYTVEIHLSQPYAPFVSMLGMAQAKIVPQEEVERLGAAFGRQPVGTGPFRFVSWVVGKEVVLQANEAYFEGRPFLDRLYCQIFPAYDLQASLAAFEQGRLEDTMVPAAERQRLLREPRYRFFRKPILGTLLLGMDTRHAPLNNPKVRKAINYAINREFMNSTIRQHRYVQAQGILPPGMPGYHPELPGYTYNPQRARELLAEAGYPGGQGLPKLELWSSVVSPEARAEHEAIQRDLQQVGLTVETHTAENWEHYKTGVLGQRPQALYRYAWYADFPDPDNFLFVLFHSQSANNFASYNNPEVDRLLEQARGENDYLQRLQMYRRAEELIMADAPTVNLLYYTFEHLFQPYVRGIELNALGEPYIPMKKIWLDTTHHAFSPTTKSQ